MAKPNEVAAAFISNNEYLKKLIDGIPDEQKGNVLDYIGQGVLRQDEFSRKMDAVTKKEQGVDAYKGTLDNWYNEKLDALTKGTSAMEELEKLKKTGVVQPPASDALKQLEGYVKKDEVEKLITAARVESEETGLQIYAHLSNLTAQHLHKYGETIDAASIIAEARKNRTSLDDAFRSLTKDKEEKLQAEAQKKDREKLRAEIEAEVRQKLGNGVYPVGNATETISPVLGKLGTDPKTAGNGEFGVEAAVNEYWKMQRPGANS